MRDFLQELDAYELRDKRNKENRMTELEQKLHEYVVSMTDKILYFPCNSAFPETVYLDHLLWNFRKGRSKEQNKTLYVACKDRSYLEIAISVCEGLSGYEHSVDDFWALRNNTRRMLYDKITKHPLYEVSK